MTTSAPIAPHDAADVDVRPEQPSGAGGPPADAVIVGVDGTECGLGAVRWAAQEAARRNAPLRIVHADDHRVGGRPAGARGLLGADIHVRGVVRGDRGRRRHGSHLRE